MANKPEKPTVKLIGTDGNVFGLIGLTVRALKRAGLADKAKEFSARAFNSSSYDQVLNIIGEYCEIE